MIVVTGRIAISEKELEERFVLSSGPGGQNVNKVATSVQLRFDAEHSPNLPVAVRRRLRALSGRRMTKDGVIVITAGRFRSRERNREDALERLLELLSRAAIAPHSRQFLTFWNGILNFFYFLTFRLFEYAHCFSTF